MGNGMERRNERGSVRVEGGSGKMRNQTTVSFRYVAREGGKERKEKKNKARRNERDGKGKGKIMCLIMVVCGSKDFLSFFGPNFQLPSLLMLSLTLSLALPLSFNSPFPPSSPFASLTR